MALVETDMTEQQEEEILGVAPKGAYILKCIAFRINEADQTPWFAFENPGPWQGKKYMSPVFQIDDDDPAKVVHKGKFPKDYRAVKGTGFMAMLRRAFPMACSGSAFDTDVAIGQRCMSKLKVTEYEGVTKNEISVLAPLKE